MIKIFLGVCAIEIILAIIFGPHSCEWGGQAYVYAGIIGLIVTLLLPFFQKNWSFIKRILYSLGFSSLLAMIWITGFMLCDFRIICKLF